QIRDLQIARQRLAGGRGEVLVLLLVALAAFDHARGVEPALDATEEAGDAAQVEPQARRPGELAAMPGQPVHEEQDVPRLFLYHRLEGLDQLFREEAGAPRHVEQAERKEAVYAFRITR